MLEPQGLLGLPVKRPGRYKDGFTQIYRYYDGTKEQAVSHGTTWDTACFIIIVSYLMFYPLVLSRTSIFI